MVKGLVGSNLFWYDFPCACRSGSEEVNPSYQCNNKHYQEKKKNDEHNADAPFKVFPSFGIICLKYLSGFIHVAAKLSYLRSSFISYSLTVTNNYKFFKLTK